MSINNNWETKFQNWTKSSSETEAQQCTNAENMIRKAINNSLALANRQIRVFAHGSSRNNTNVKQNSDVDICVCCFDTNFTDFSSASFTKADVGLLPATYLYPAYKLEVHQALINQFGSDGVIMGNKAFDVHPNSYRVEADVVAAFEHRRYTGFDPFRGGYQYASGIQFFSSTGEEIVNWPDQHHANGVAKNNATNYQFKYVTRILKRLRYEMKNAGIASASGISSFIVECMAYNVPNQGFLQGSYTDDVRYILAHLYNGTSTPTNCSSWVEVSGMKWLFYNQELKRQSAFTWVSDAWSYIGFN